MNANAMAQELELRLNAVDAFNGFSYEDEEISNFLNIAQSLYIEQNLDELLNPKKTGFEETESRGQALSALIKSSTCTASTDQSGAFPYGVFYDLPEDFKLSISEEIYINKLHCLTKTNIQATVEVISHDEYNRLKRNYYRTPYYNSFEAKVWRMYANRTTSQSEGEGTAKRHQIITDSNFNVSEYKIRYIINTPDIVVDRSNLENMRNCVLDADLTHRKIVELAVALIDSSNKEQRPNPLPLNTYN